MEVAVSCAVGVLTACCLSGVLSWYADGGGARRMSAINVLSDVAGRLGQMALDAGVIPARVVDKLAREVNALPVAERFEKGRVSRAAALGMTMFAMAIGALVGWALFMSPMGAAVGAGGPVALLGGRSRVRERSARKNIEGSMPDTFGALAISLESGLSLSQTMRYVGGHAPEPVRTEFMRVSFSVDCGIPAAQALDSMIARMDAPGLELVTLALKVSQRTGAPLKDLLGEASRLVASRIELERRLDVKTSQARMSAQLVAAMPVVMVGFLGLLSSDFQQGLVTVPGLLSVAVALVLNAMAWSIIRQIMKVRL